MSLGSIKSLNLSGTFTNESIKWDIHRQGSLIHIYYFDTYTYIFFFIGYLPLPHWNVKFFGLFRMYSMEKLKKVFAPFFDCPKLQKLDGKVDLLTRTQKYLGPYDWTNSCNMYLGGWIHAKSVSG